LRISGADGHDTARQAEDLCEGDRRGVEHRRDPRERADPARTTDMSPVEHLAQYIGTTTEAVLENIPNAVLQALCSVPQYTRLRRVHDATILGNLRTLVDAMPADDLRRPRLGFLHEDAERRTRMSPRAAPAARRLLEQCPLEPRLAGSHLLEREPPPRPYICAFVEDSAHARA
jgi:hypothetical protein